MNEFVHLHTHTVHSLLDGFTKVADLVALEKSRGSRAVAITDHGNMAGVPALFREAKKAGIKPIAGIEAYICEDMKAKGGGKGVKTPYYHVTLLAANLAGYQNLCRLSSKSYTEGFYQKPRIDFDCLANHSNGVICMSGCVGGWSQQLILQGKHVEAEKLIGKFHDVFLDKFLLEMQWTGEADQKVVNDHYITLSSRLGLPLVVTGDSHYLCKEDSDDHDTLLCVGTRKPKAMPGSSEGRPTKDTRMKFNQEQYFVRSAAEMLALGFPASAYKNSLVVADMVESYDLPRAAGHPVSLSLNEELSRYALEGLWKRFPEPKDDEVTRLLYELETVQELEYANYFLTVREIVHWAKSQGMFFGWGRGSSAGSLLSYALGITNINPLQHGLYFERFLNKHRKEPPDIDLDFTDEDRPGIIEQVKDQYKHVAHIGSYSTLGPKQVVLDLCNVFGRGPQTLAAAMAMIPHDPTFKIAHIFENQPLYRGLKSVLGEDIMHCMKRFDSLPRHATMHAAGVIIDTAPIEGKVPFMGREEKGICTQYNYDDMHDLGYEKIDILGLKTLRMIREASDIAGINPHDLPLDDKETYELLSAGATTGVFQLESWGYKKFLRQFRPRNFNDLMMTNALYRPGPMQGGKGLEALLARRFGEEETKYLHKSLKPILEETYGIMVYQEQVMASVRALTNWTLEQADDLRRVIGKKKMDDIKGLRKSFIDSCARCGHSQKFAQEAFDQVEFFSRYGWNKAHAAAYGMVTYVTAYLKAHYDVAFIIACLNMDLNNADRVKTFIKEAREMKVKILPVDINMSGVGYKFHMGCALSGFRAIKGVGERAGDWIIGEREHGPFKSVDDFKERIPARVVNKTVFELLRRHGAFHRLPQTTAQTRMLEEVPF